MKYSWCWIFTGRGSMTINICVAKETSADEVCTQSSIADMAEKEELVGLATWPHNSNCSRPPSPWYRRKTNAQSIS